MFSGQRAFRGETYLSILTAILHDEPRSLRDIRATIPPSLEQHVARCLRKDPAQRFQTMRDLKQALVEAASTAMTKAVLCGRVRRSGDLEAFGGSGVASN
jgi:hypothetical protein